MDLIYSLRHRKCGVRGCIHELLIASLRLRNRFAGALRKPSSRARNFTKVPKPIHHFKAYRTKNDVEMFLTGEIEYKMYCDQQMQNEAIFINAANSRRILAFRSKQ